MALRAAAPAKLNLSLAVTGRRPDGFHELVSVVAPINLEDALAFRLGDRGDTLACDDATVPSDGANLVLRAAAAYRRRVPGAPAGRWELAKRIPHGAGLGGGSSDAAAALLLLNQAAGGALGEAELAEVAAEVGSDCPLFLRRAACVLRGRGERAEVLPPAARAAFSGRRVILAKPAWGVSSAEAYRWLAEEGRHAEPAQAEDALRAALGAEDPLVAVVELGNALQAPVVRRHPELGLGLAELRRRLGLRGAMTGSGSACFLLADGREDLGEVRAVLGPLWGSGAWVSSASLL